MTTDGKVIPSRQILPAWMMIPGVAGLLAAVAQQPQEEEVS